MNKRVVWKPRDGERERERSSGAERRRHCASRPVKTAAPGVRQFPVLGGEVDYTPTLIQSCSAHFSIPRAFGGGIERGAHARVCVGQTGRVHLL